MTRDIAFVRQSRGALALAALAALFLAGVAGQGGAAHAAAPTKAADIR